MAEEMVVVKTHRRGFAPPPWRMLQALTEHLDSWIEIREAELRPTVLVIDGWTVVWSSLWADRPGDRLRLEVGQDGGGSLLRWSLECPAGALPGEARVKQMRYRINQLLNGELRGHLDTRG